MTIDEINNMTLSQAIDELKGYVAALDDTNSRFLKAVFKDYRQALNTVIKFYEATDALQIVLNKNEEKAIGEKEAPAYDDFVYIWFSRSDLEDFTDALQTAIERIDLQSCSKYDRICSCTLDDLRKKLKKFTIEY